MSKISGHIIFQSIKSFTIIELVVVMAIASTVIILVISFIGNLWFSFHRIQAQVNTENKSYMFFQKMQENITTSDYVLYDDDEMEFFKNDSLKGSYYFNKKNIIFENDYFTDTLIFSDYILDTTSISTKDKDWLTSITIRKINDTTFSYYFNKQYNNQVLYRIANKQE